MFFHSSAIKNTYSQKKIHILISCNFFFVFIPLQGSNCPPVTSVEKKKSRSACKLDHLFFIQTDPFCIPICRPNGDLSAVRETPLPHVTPQPFLHVVVGMTVRGFSWGLFSLMQCVSFSKVLTISLLRLSSRKGRCELEVQKYGQSLHWLHEIPGSPRPPLEFY